MKRQGSVPYSSGPGGGSRGGTRATKKQSTAARTYITKDPTRSAAAKKAYETRMANAKKARIKRETGILVGGMSAGAAAGYGSSYVKRGGAEGPKGSIPVKKKKKRG